MTRESHLGLLFSLLCLANSAALRNSDQNQQAMIALEVASGKTSLDSAAGFRGFSQISAVDDDEIVEATEETDSDGAYYYDGDSDNSTTIDEMVNDYHSGKTTFNNSEVNISGGVEECNDCTSAIVPIGEYDEYVEYFTTEYDEYYLVKIPVTRHDVYTITETPQVSHSVYYTTGDYTVEDEITECEGCPESTVYGTGESEEEEGSGSSGSSTVVKKTTTSSGTESSDDAGVDTSGRVSSSSNVNSGEASGSSDSTTYNSSQIDYDEDCVVNSSDITVTEVEEYDEYVVTEIPGCQNCTNDLFLEVDSSYNQLEADFYDNDETDSNYMTLVSPSSNTAPIEWDGDIYTDHDEYLEDKDETQNPVAVHSFLQYIDNALDRDEDELPQDFDDAGDEPYKGKLAFLLVGTFVENSSGEGTVVVFPEDDSKDSFELITGLDKPVSLCFDDYHSFLYVVDPSFGDQGYIYQFTIDWDSDESFEVSDHDYTIVYQGANPYGCSVDEYGNLYFVDATENIIALIQYLDLWSGFTNYYITLYEAADNNTLISTPVGISVYDSADLYFVNNDVDNAPVLVVGDTIVPETNSVVLDSLYTGSNGGWAVAATEDYTYFTAADNNLWAYDNDKQTAFVKSKTLEDPRGVSYSHDKVYVADYGRGQIVEFDDSDDQDETGDLYKTVSNPYAVLCVNY